MLRTLHNYNKQDTVLGTCNSNRIRIIRPSGPSVAVLHTNHYSVNRRVLKRDFGDDIRDFKYLLEKVIRDEVFSQT